MESIPDYKKVASQSLFWKMAERISNQGVQLVVQIVLARFLAPNDFGILAIMLIVINIANALSQSGLNTALVQCEGLREGDYSTVFWFSIVVSSAMYLGIWILSPLIATFYNQQTIVPLLRVLGIIVIVCALYAIQLAYVGRNFQFKQAFISTAAAVICSGVCGITAAIVGLGAWALVIQQLIYHVTASAVLWIVLPWHPKMVFEVRRAASLFRFGWKILVNSLMEQLYQGCFDLLVGKVYSTNQLGIMSQGKKYPQAAGNAMDATIQPVMLPVMSRIHEEKTSYSGATRKVTRILVFCLIPAMLWLSAYSPNIVVTLLGEKWSASAPFFSLYCVVYLFVVIKSLFITFYNAAGRSDLGLIAEAAKKVIGLVTVVVLISRGLNPIAVVVGLCLIELFGLIIEQIINSRVIGYTFVDQIKDIVIPGVISISAVMLSLLITRYFIANNMTAIVVGLTITTTAYLLVSALLNRITLNDVKETIAAII